MTPDQIDMMLCDIGISGSSMQQVNQFLLSMVNNSNYTPEELELMAFSYYQGYNDGSKSKS